MSKTAPLKVTLERKNQDYLFEAKGKTGTSVLIDNTSQENAAGASPMELLLMGVGGCSAIDIVYILKKQRQKVMGYKMEVSGARKEVRDAKPFSAMHVTIYLEGEIDPEKAKRAGQLSFDKYCSVSITMEASVNITHSIFVNGKSVD
ncbi:hypothetical protein SCB49_08057 [unidentified eubacterium SCB49]|nr:hypothetical protein SCB49_08057 [unidentified eubacterium SCB49]